MTPLDHVVSHAIRSLPDSLAEREVLIGHILTVLPRKHPARDGLMVMMAGLTQQSLLQLELPNLLSGEATKKN